MKRIFISITEAFSTWNKEMKNYTCFLNKWMERSIEKKTELEIILAKGLYRVCSWISGHAFVRLSGYFILMGVSVSLYRDTFAWQQFVLWEVGIAYLLEWALSLYHIFAMHSKLSDNEEDIRELNEMDSWGLLATLEYMKYLYHSKRNMACKWNRYILLFTGILIAGLYWI